MAKAKVIPFQPRASSPSRPAPTGFNQMLAAFIEGEIGLDELETFLLDKSHGGLVAELVDLGITCRMVDLLGSSTPRNLCRILQTFDVTGHET